MVEVACPLCGGKGLEIVWGMPIDQTVFEDDPNIVSGGCCIELGVTHQCADCHHRWGLGEDAHYGALGWLGERCGVDVDHLLDNLDARFLPMYPRDALQCPDHGSPFNGDQVVLGSPGLVVLSAYGSGTVEVAEFGTIIAQPGFYVPIRIRPVRLFVDDTRGGVDRADHLARVIKDASRRRRASFRSCASCGRKTPPEWNLDDHRCIQCVAEAGTDSPTQTQLAIAGFEPVSETGLWWVGDLDGVKIVAETDEPEDDTEVWSETEPDNRMTLQEFDDVQGEGVVGWLAEPEPYEADPPTFEDPDDPKVSPDFSDPDALDMRGPHLRGKGRAGRKPPQRGSTRRKTVLAPEAAEILGCTVAELTDWRRNVLPGMPRWSRQEPDEFRPQEVVAIAVGRWLRHVPKRTTRASDYFVSHLVANPPTGEDWVVVRQGPHKIEVVYGTASFDMAARKRAPHVYSPAPVFDALRNRRTGT